MNVGDRFYERNPAGIKNFVSRFHRLPVQVAAPVGHIVVGQFRLPPVVDQAGIADVVIAFQQNNTCP